METFSIVREIDGKEKTFELTEKEQLECGRVFRRNFYREELRMNYPEYSERKKEGIVYCADTIYCDGDGDTEYEALEKAIKIYENVNY